MKKRNKYLIIQSAFIGDVILATSLVETIKSEDKESEIYFFLRKGNEEILKSNPHIKNIFIWDKKDKFTSLIKNILLIRKEKFDYAINIQRFFNSALCLVLSKASVKIGFNKSPLSFLFNHKITHDIPMIKNSLVYHEIDRNNELLKPIMKTKALRPKLYFEASENEKILNSFKAPYIVMAPTSVWSTKALHPDQWKQIIQALPQYHFLMIGAKGDESRVDEIIKGFSNTQNLCGKLSLKESAILMKNANWCLVNDSAPLHLASSVDAKVIAFFCSTIKEFGYFPLSSTSHIFEVNNLACRPCGLHGKRKCPLEHFKCSRDINIEEVIKLLSS